MSTHRPRPTSRRAPLAARESLESRMEDFTELREFTRAGGHHEKPRDLKLKPQNLTQQEFYEMSRKQQNLDPEEPGEEDRDPEAAPGPRGQGEEPGGGLHCGG